MKLEQFINHPGVTMAEKGHLVSFCYNQETVFDKKWDEITRAARGIIFDRDTGELLARPWNKFFNLGEMPETRLENIINLQQPLFENPFFVSKKLDGSLGIMYYDKCVNNFAIATKGSFVSEQAQFATEWARHHMNLSNIDFSFTYLFEIIYPANKIVVDYQDKAGLVLLGMVNKVTGQEVSPSLLQESAAAINVECVEQVEFDSISAIVANCETLVGEEGFVITFLGIQCQDKVQDLKIKIKGEWYKKMHALVSSLTPLGMWRAWEVGGIPRDYLMVIPEEFKDASLSLANVINELHSDEASRVENIYEKITTELGGNPDIKSFAIKCQQEHKSDMSILIGIYKQQNDKVWDMIHKKVRPTGNALPDYLNDKIDKTLLKWVGRVISNQ